MAGKSKKNKGAAKAAPLTTQILTIRMTVAKRYGHRIEGLFEEAVGVLVDRIAGAQVKAEISNLKKGT